MTRTHKLLGAAAAALMMLATATAPAKAQFAGGGGQDMMTQMAPMLEMMKAKMGKKRFATLMQTMGPMMSNMMDGSGGGGFGGMNLSAFSGGSFGGGNFGGSPGAPSIGGDYGTGASGGLPFIGGGGGGFNAGDMMSMIPQFMSLANMGGSGHHRRHARHKS